MSKQGNVSSLGHTYNNTVVFNFSHFIFLKQIPLDHKPTYVALPYA